MNQLDILGAAVATDRRADDLQVCATRDNGCTSYDRKTKKVIGIAAPVTGSAESRTIRLHELCHANLDVAPSQREIKRYLPQTLNAVGDAVVHLLLWPDSLPPTAHRDCLAVGLGQGHMIASVAIPPIPQAWRSAMITVIRSLAIASRYHRIHKLESRLNRRFGPLLVGQILHVVDLIEIAGRAIVAPRRKVDRQRRAEILDAVEHIMRIVADQPPKAAGGSGEGVADRPTNPGRGDGSGRPAANPMTICQLPLVAPCDSTAPRRVFRSTGSVFNPRRLCNAVASGSTSQLFRRRAIAPAGGAVLFDASGSMGVSSEKLAEVCKLTPAATVAYYSCKTVEGTQPGAYGQLKIFAKDGSRADSAPAVGGGNAVDLQALQWLLAQPAPRVFVTDVGFCGGADGDPERAEDLLAVSIASGAVRLVGSIAEYHSELLAGK